MNDNAQQPKVASYTSSSWVPIYDVVVATARTSQQQQEKYPWQFIKITPKKDETKYIHLGCAVFACERFSLFAFYNFFIQVSFAVCINRNFRAYSSAYLHIGSLRMSEIRKGDDFYFTLNPAWNEATTILHIMIRMMSWTLCYYPNNCSADERAIDVSMYIFFISHTMFNSMGFHFKWFGRKCHFYWWIARRRKNDEKTHTRTTHIHSNHHLSFLSSKWCELLRTVRPHFVVCAFSHWEFFLPKLVRWIARALSLFLTRNRIDFYVC